MVTASFEEEVRKKATACGADDYIKKPFTYENLEEFYSKNKEADMVYFSSHGTKIYTENNFKDNQFLIFGKESVGLPNELLDKNSKNTFHIPIYSSHVRSLNLANAVSIVVYDGLRSINL